MAGVQLRIDPKQNRFFIGEFLGQKKVRMEELRQFSSLSFPTTLVIQSTEPPKKRFSWLRKVFQKKEKPIDIHELLFLPICSRIKELWVLEPYSELDKTLKHCVLIRNTYSFTFEAFSAQICDFLIVHKHVKYLTLNSIRAPGLATVIKSNPDLELLTIRSTLLPVDVVSFVEILFLTDHNPCCIDLLKCPNTREISSLLDTKGFKMESMFDSMDNTTIKATHSMFPDYFVEIGFRRTVTISALRHIREM
ncbi:hypothetical protein L596_016168 [Steinernema carpocapsae]|uniref:Uncharacterized protein n=1 Tax=Steinernema carpocapsae TaxID=34508 RepID=A0A4U5NHT1_STECR|nr:hypothetical protein L596_016168 [Steinernema carpocapsae]